MLENDIFEQWLSDEAGKVLVKLKNNEPLSQDDKLVIVLKGQMNHFHHLDVELRQEVHTLRQEMDGRFTAMRQEMDRRFDVITDEIKQLHGEITQLHGEIKNIYRVINTQTWKMIGAVGLIVLLGRLIENF